ncbi:MAG TPA: penicillin-binding transpeptidase domain-containing protein [Thermodesulfobacteriota bacterium]|nr:penicillin-binding transpeptidase domain-containing protein [Thermodesulfobacteriota bacterium]
MTGRKSSKKRISLARDLTKPMWKISIVGGMLLILFTAVSVRALKLQVLSTDKAFELARKQHTGLFTLLPRRGRILDINKKELAINVDAVSSYVHPGNVKDPKQFSLVLSKLVKRPQKEVLNMLLSQKPFVWITRLGEPELISKLKSANLDGIGFVDEPKRVYPNGHLAGQVLGFTNIDSKGIEGIEYEFESLLAGSPGRITVKRDARGRHIISTPTDVEASVSGYDIILHLDSQIQYIVEKELKEGIKKASAEKGMALLMDPETGAILAMASYPFFDPNEFNKYSGDSRRNLPIWYSFEPGSTIKMFLAAAALEDKKVNLSSKFDCENGKRKVGPYFINDVHPYGVLNVAQIVELSSNVCASKIAETLGKDRFHAYLRSFGFGEKTEIDLPGESTGRLASPKKWGPVELATLSFGQGISVTAIQLASALSAIANGGYLLKPRVVKEIVSPDGKVVKGNEPEVVGRVISYDTAETIKGILEGVVENGTGKQASIPGYRVAGKTGTAQIPNPETGGYYSNRYLSSFIGFAPVDDPKITLVIVVENPKTSNYGGVVAAPIFRAITEKVLFYKGIPPQKGFVEAKIMPDLRGKSARDILRWAEKEGLKVKLTGSGYVKDQKPRAGERIKADTVCSVELRQTI